MKYTSCPQRGGFTLIELLVVISIIALLIAILLPALRRARETAITLECLAQVRQVTVATNAYSSDEDGWYPHRPSVGYQPHIMRSIASTPPFDLNETFIFRYLGGQSARDQVMFCPGPLSEARNATSNGYGYSTNPSVSNRFVTYQYLNVTNSTLPKSNEEHDLRRNVALGWLPLWGDLTLRTSAGTGAILSHEIPLQFISGTQEITGGNFTRVDGSGRWFSEEDMEVYITSSINFYRPNVEQDGPDPD